MQLAELIPEALDAPEAAPRVQVDLLQLLEHQGVLYRRLATLAERQRAMVVADDPQPLLTVLAERQRLVEGLVGLNQKLAPYRRHWTRVYGVLDGSARQRVDELVNEANQTLSAILSRDGQDCATLNLRRQTAAVGLAALDAGHRASTAYASAGTRRGAFLTDAQV